MADDSNAEVGFDAIVGALNENLRAFRCTVCHSDQFAIIEQPDQDLRTNIHLFKGRDPVAKKQVELLTLACTNCGHVEQFVQKVLLERLRSRKAADE